MAEIPINNQHDFFKNVVLDENGALKVTGDLTPVQLETLSHFVYNPTTDKLEADKAIVTTLSSLFLGEQHKMSSAGENVFFTNMVSKDAYYPMWGGLKDMTVVANRGENGLIAPSGRFHFGYGEGELNGVVGTGVTSCEAIVTIPQNTSGIGAEILFEQNIVPSDKVYYEVWWGTDATGIQAFEDIKTNLTITAGDLFEWIYPSPLESKTGQQVYARLRVEDAEGNFTLLQCRQSVDGRAYFKLKGFTFEDKDLAFKSDVENIVSGAIYKGAYNATTDTPSLVLTGSEVNGDFFKVSVGGGVYEVGDLIIYNGSTTSYDHIPVKAVTQDNIEMLGLNTYDVYCKAGVTTPTQNGSALYPYSSLADAIAGSSDGDTIFLDGVFIIGSEITLPHSLYFYGAEGTEIKYNTYSASNGDLLSINGTNTETFEFYNITFKNAGGYGLYIRNVEKFVAKDCEFINNGWNGSAINTIVDSATSGILGYDSSNADLQNFYSGSNASNGGALRVQDARVVELLGNVVKKNLRGLRLQNCGVLGYGYVTRNQISENIESGIYLASNTYDATGGCENFTVYNNASKYNANNGILVIGGINNVVSLNIVEGNWNAGIMGWHVSNTRFRDLDLTNNNRSQYNGIGNTGDAHSSITIGGDTARAERGYIASVLSCEVYNTGLGSNTSRIGFQVLQDVEDITGTYEKNLINIDDSGFHKQDYSIDVLADLDNVKLTIGDCRYIDTVETNIAIQNGSYYEQPFSNHITNLKECDFSIDGESVILKEGINGVRLNPYTVHDLQANLSGSNINIMLKGSEKIQFNLEVTGVSIDGVLLTGTDQEKVNQINALLQHSGSSTGQAPVITSSLAVSLQQGSTLNYELTADFGVGYEWDLSNVSGITTVEGHVRNLIGGSNLSVGTYNIPVKAINYNGEDSEVLVLTVSTPPFSNNKSINFANQDYLGANASLLSSTLGRTGNGSGSSDAWSISMWYKGSTNTQGQTIFYFGDATTTNRGHIVLHQINIGGSKGLRFRYGHQYNKIQLQTTGINPNTWQHILISYDGGTTGSQSTQINDYYGRFNIFIDGVLKNTTNSHTAFGYNGGIDADNFRIGRYSSGNYMRDCRVDELAVFNSDQSSNISDIYNSGNTFDLSTLATAPRHWWRMGDGDTYPYIQDNGTQANCVFQMYNQTAADIVTDAP